MCGNLLWQNGQRGKQTVAVFSDIHSNYHAFKACFADAKQQGAQGFIFLGDYVSDLAEPRKVLDLVYEIREKYPAVCLRGNRERYMLQCRAGETEYRPGSKTGSLLFTYNRLREQDLDFFQSLPISGQIQIGGVPFEIAHAVRDNDRLYFEQEDPGIQDVFAQMQATYLLTGHSHRQYLQKSGGKTIINPGSVGIPQGGGRWPQYALLEVENGAVNCRFRQVPYDLSQAIHAQFASGLTQCAGCWAISILYDIITAREYTMQLLDRVSKCANGDLNIINNEDTWRVLASQMGMKFTEAEITAYYREAFPSDAATK